MQKDVKLWAFLLSTTGVILFLAGIQSQSSTKGGVGLLLLSLFFGILGFGRPKVQGYADLVEQRRNALTHTGGGFFRHPDVKYWAWLKEQIRGMAIGAFWLGAIPVVALALLSSFSSTGSFVINFLREIGGFWVVGAFFVGVILLQNLNLVFEGIHLLRVNLARGAADSPEIVARIEKAFENVKEIISKHRMTGGDWRRAIAYHSEFERMSASSLESFLVSSGVLNPHLHHYNRGKTLREAIALAVWQSKLRTEESIALAAEVEYARTSAQAATAADIQKRRDLEQQKAAIERELARLSNYSPQSAKWETPDE